MSGQRRTWSLLPLTHSLFDLGGQLFGRVSPDFSESGMIVRHGGELVDCHSEMHGGDDFMDQFATQRACTTSAYDLAVDWVGQQFHKAVPGFHD